MLSGMILRCAIVLELTQHTQTNLLVGPQSAPRLWRESANTLETSQTLVFLTALVRLQNFSHRASS